MSRSNSGDTLEAVVRKALAAELAVYRRDHSIGRLEAKIGCSASYLSRLLAGSRRPQLSIVDSVLRAIDIDPIQWLRRLGTEEKFPEELALPQRITRLWQILEEAEEGSTDTYRPVHELAAGGTRFDLMESASEDPPKMPADFLVARRSLPAACEALRELDDYRYLYSHEAASWALRFIEHLPRIETAPTTRMALYLRALGVYASACRVCAELQQAEAVLDHVLIRAEQHGMTDIQADLLLRRGAVHLVKGDYGQLMRDVNNAWVLFVPLRDFAGMGKCCVDLAVGFYRQNQIDTARGLALKALRMLPRQERRNRMATLQLMAALNNTGQALAERHLRAATRLTRNSYERATVVHLRAKLLEERGDLDGALALFSAAKERFFKVAPIDAFDSALCEVGVLLRQGHVIMAHKAINAALSLSEGLRRASPRAESELLRLCLHTSQRGQLSLRLVELARRRAHGLIR